MRSLRWLKFPPLDGESRPITGYFVGVAAGATAFWLIAGILVWLLSQLHTDPTSASDLKYVPPDLSILITLYLCILLMWIIFSWYAAALLFLLTRWIAKRLGIFSVSYYALCGAVSGSLLFALHAQIAWSFRAGEPGPFWPDLGVAGLSYCLGGAVGGLVFWRIGVRPGRFRTEPSSDAEPLYSAPAAPETAVKSPERSGG